MNLKAGFVVSGRGGLRLLEQRKCNLGRRGQFVSSLYELGSHGTALLVPTIPTAEQFVHVLGGKRERLRRIGTSVLGVLFSIVLGGLLGRLLQSLLCGVFALLPILAPLLKASKRNAEIRKLPYAAVFRGTIDRIMLQGETLTAHLSDLSGRFIGIPLSNRGDSGEDALHCGQDAYAVIFSKRPSFPSVQAVTDMYVTELDEFYGSYPYLSRENIGKVIDALDDALDDAQAPK
eukprot:CAMPEP_0198723316 /NCGR_PEP_ID=MMETSP1475-20131203/844_1 /TAXON_ID= ORGANISM="Unidentified sp., Strain CCMP1999" /NCGR_SAMPLE_ID=MMETSP1475 /ASSEMBLY_ACC=CAM_ASM_001111 /LENGTH=232 /DNA_ID=CAMNT_0044484403 /DNA_START=47 /DNA_END=745 /DNA_ORIENTATION=-